MKGALRIGSVAGVGIFVHWTFFLLLLWLAGSRLIRSGWGAAGFADAAGEVAFVSAVFVCVVLHELGHALAARRYGVGTRDITLLPIGGVARLERMPERPWEEFVVAVAGPAVNVAIAAVLGAVLVALGTLSSLLPRGSSEAYWASQGFLGRLALVNIALVLFNMLPAFPMDGGRVLRAALAAATDRETGTRIAAKVGQAMALLFAIAGIFLNQPMLILIAIFVFFGAQAEAGDARARSTFTGLRVRDAMVTRFRALAADATLQDAVEALLSGSQEDFPVVSAAEAGRLVGVLPRSDLLRGLATRGRDTPIHEIMRRDCPAATEAEPLDAAFERVQRGGCPLVPVLRGGALVGLLTLENLAELIMVHQADRAGGGGARRRPPGR